MRHFLLAPVGEAVIPASNCGPMNRQRSGSCKDRGCPGWHCLISGFHAVAEGEQMQLSHEGREDHEEGGGGCRLRHVGSVVKAQSYGP